MRVFVLLACLALAGCHSHSNEVLLGEVEPMTGTEAAFGTSTHKGIALAVDEINAAGGINGKSVRLLTVDDQGKADESALAATKLITEDRVVALLSGGNSSLSLAKAPISQSNHVPFLATGATNPKVTAQGDYVFRTCFIDPFQGLVMAHFAAKTLKLRRVAILKDVKSDYSVGLSEFFAAKFKQEGGEVVADHGYSAGDVEFRSQLTAILAKKPDAIFIPGYYTEVALILRQAKGLGNTAVLLGADGWDSPKLKEIAGVAAAGGFFSSQYSPENTEFRVQKFIQAYKARYSVAPDASAALGYDGTQVLADAIRRAKELTSTDIRDALAATKNFVGVTGSVRIDANRNAVKSAVIIRVDEKGDPRFYTSIAP